MQWKAVSNDAKALVFFWITICTLYALVANAEGETISKAHPTAEQMQQEAKWTGHLNYIFGYKKLSNDWEPTEDQIEFGLVDLDLRRVNWHVSIVGQLLLTYASDIPDEPGFRGDYSGTYEFNVGVRKVWGDLPRFHPFLGGGFSILGGSTTEDLGDLWYYQEENDSGFGYWVGAGFYWVLTEQLHTGINAQYTWGEIELFDKDLNAGGIHLNIIIGCHW
jgi:hypothetical protein